MYNICLQLFTLTLCNLKISPTDVIFGSQLELELNRLQLISSPDSSIKSTFE